MNTLALLCLDAKRRARDVGIFLYTELVSTHFFCLALDALSGALEVLDGSGYHRLFHKCTRRSRYDRNNLSLEANDSENCLYI